MVKLRFTPMQLGSRRWKPSHRECGWARTSPRLGHVYVSSANWWVMSYVVSLPIRRLPHTVIRRIKCQKMEWTEHCFHRHSALEEWSSHSTCLGPFGRVCEGGGGGVSLGYWGHLRLPMCDHLGSLYKNGCVSSLWFFRCCSFLYILPAIIVRIKGKGKK